MQHSEIWIAEHRKFLECVMLMGQENSRFFSCLTLWHVFKCIFCSVLYNHPVIQVLKKITNYWCMHWFGRKPKDFWWLKQKFWRLNTILLMYYLINYNILEKNSNEYLPTVRDTVTVYQGALWGDYKWVNWSHIWNPRDLGGWGKTITCSSLV